MGMKSVTDAPKSASSPVGGSSIGHVNALYYTKYSVTFVISGSVHPKENAEELTLSRDHHEKTCMCTVHSGEGGRLPAVCDTMNGWSEVRKGGSWSSRANIADGMGGETKTKTRSVIPPKEIETRGFGTYTRYLVRTPYIHRILGANQVVIYTLLTTLFTLILSTCLQPRMYLFFLLPIPRPFLVVMHVTWYTVTAVTLLLVGVGTFTGGNRR